MTFCYTELHRGVTEIQETKTLWISENLSGSQCNFKISHIADHTDYRK